MRFDDQYTAVIGDLLIERCQPAADYALVLSRTDDGPEAVLVAAIPDGAAYGIGEANGYARLSARAPTMSRLLCEAARGRLDCGSMSATTARSPVPTRRRYFIATLRTVKASTRGRI